MRTTTEKAVVLCLCRTQEARTLSLPSPLINLLVLSGTKPNPSGSTFCFSVALVTKKHKHFPGICEAVGGKAATAPIRGICYQTNSMILHSLLKLAAIAVLKLMSAVIAIKHFLSVSIKSLSVNIMPLEFSLGKLNYDSTIFSKYHKFIGFKQKKIFF